MSDTSAVSIKYNDLAELGKAIEGNGGNLGSVLSYAVLDHNSTITANAAAHEAIAKEKKYKKVFEKMAVQEKINLDNIGNDLYEMEASLINYYNTALGNTEG